MVITTVSAGTVSTPVIITSRPYVPVFTRPYQTTRPYKPPTTSRRYLPWLSTHTGSCSSLSPHLFPGNYGHLLAEVTSFFGVRSSVYCISGQINWLINWLIEARWGPLSPTCIVKIVCVKLSKLLNEDEYIVEAEANAEAEAKGKKYEI